METTEAKAMRLLKEAETDALRLDNLRAEVTRLSPLALLDLIELADAFKGCHIEL
jgi:hypothetical protein